MIHYVACTLIIYSDETQHLRGVFTVHVNKLFDRPKKVIWQQYRK
jgi:hypothetical protein